MSTVAKLPCTRNLCNDPFCDRDHIHDEEPAEECRLCGGDGPLYEYETQDRSVGYAETILVCESCIEKGRHQ